MNCENYPKYTVENLHQLVQAILQNKPAVTEIDIDPVYDKLFKGLDITILSLMCTQVKLSTVGEMQDELMRAINGYADRINMLIPVLYKTSGRIEAEAKYFLNSIDQVTILNKNCNATKAIQIFADLKKKLLVFNENNQSDIDSAKKLGNDLGNFIISTLSPAIADKAHWIKPELEQCLSNDKFVKGTQVSVYNSKTIFSFTTNNAAQSIKILMQADDPKTIDDIMFSLDGQLKVWKIIACVSKKLHDALSEFIFWMLPNSKMRNGENKMSETIDESRELLQNVTTISQQVMAANKVPPNYKMAQLMLRLMNGDTKVLQELPTLQPQTAVLRDTVGDITTNTSSDSIVASTGLMGLTKENIRDIKTYVRTALAFKTNEDDLAVVLGYDKNSPMSKDHPEFAPAKFATFYKPFNIHAQLWADIESDILKQGNAVQTYGTTFVAHAEFFLNQLQQMNLYAAKSKDTKLTDPDDQAMQTGLSEILDKWNKETQLYQESTDNVLKRLVSFQKTLANTLQPSGNVMLNLLNRLDLATETKELKQKIDDLHKQVQAQQQEYNKDCGLACSGAAGLIAGPLVIITWAVTGGIYGAKAEKARKERNKLQAELEEKTKLYNTLNAVADNVHQATNGIANLDIAITNAITGLRSLNTVWSLVVEYITSAKDSLLKIDCNKALVDFMFGLTSAKAAWNEVPSLAKNLLDLFRQADTLITLQADFNEAKHLPAQAVGDSSYIFDAAIWNDRYSAVHKIIINPSSKFMPVLQQKAAELREAADSITDSIVQQLPILATVHGKPILRISDPDIIEDLLRKASTNPEDQAALDTWTTYFKETASQFNAKLESLENSLQSNVEILQKNTRTDLSVTGFYAQLNAECKRFGKAIQGYTKMILENFIAPMQELTTQMKDLDTNIQTKLDPQNIIGSFKEFLPSEAEISELLTKECTAPETAKINEVKLVYSTALKGFDVIQNTISLCQQISKRAKLTRDLRSLQEQYDEMHKNWADMLDDQAELMELLKMHNLLRFFAYAGKEELASLENTRRQLFTHLNATPIDYAAYHQTLNKYIHAFNSAPC